MSEREQEAGVDDLHLVVAAKRGATLEDLAWMENIYSPPIGALFEPVAIAAQNGLAAIRDAERTPA